MTVHSTQSALVKDEGATSIHINIKINYQQSNIIYADGFEQQTAVQIVINGPMHRVNVAKARRCLSLASTPVPRGGAGSRILSRCHVHPVSNI